MQELELSLEGTGAEEAAQELFDMKGVVGHWQMDVSEDLDGEDILMTNATLVGISGDAAEIAQQICNWYMEWKQGKQGKKLKKVVLVDPHNRQMLLDHVRVSNLTQMLAKLR